MEFEFWVRLVQAAKASNLNRKQFVLKAISEKIESVLGDTSDEVFQVG
jgi:uncharacterized protein (DUF1778 family)